MRHNLDERAAGVMGEEPDSANQIPRCGSDVSMGVVSICDTWQSNVIREQLGESWIVDVPNLANEPFMN
jgi:hypothetical protein